MLLKYSALRSVSSYTGRRGRILSFGENLRERRRMGEREIWIEMDTEKAQKQTQAMSSVELC